MFERSPAPTDHWTDVLHEDDRGGARAIWDSAVAERAALPEIVCRFGAAEDAERWVAVRAEPVSHDQGALDGYVGIAADITEPKRSAMALAAAKAAAESANAVKSEFLAHMSHEMRTPLNGIVGMTALALDGELTADQRDCLETVQGSAESLLTLVGDVLDFSRLEAARLPLRVRSFDLRETIARTLKPLAIRAAHRGLELRHAIDPETPDQLSGDADRLRQVLINLVANAIKFTEAGRIDVAIASRPGADGSVVVSFAVTDTGIGIPLDKQRIIFAPFEQVDGSLTRTHDGTGLGLAIAAKLVALMGGEMSVDSTLGRGSTFRFTARLTPEASSAVAIPAAALAPAATITPLHVLVVDDNEVNRRIALRMLRKLGHTAVEAENGRLALAALEDDDYDLVLMDIQMPEMDGLAATTAIRERERDSGVHVPIVALTAHALENDRTMCLAAGMDGHLTKPLTVKALTTAIAQSMSAAAAPAVARLPQQRVASVVCLGPPVSGRDAALSGVRA
jgi:signal transduction histidine kinase/CheY-like chemotaxis protein